MVDRGSNRRVSKNHIGGVKVSRIALSVVDRGSNLSVVDRGSNRVSKNDITNSLSHGVKQPSLSNDRQCHPFCIIALNINS